MESKWGSGMLLGYRVLGVGAGLGMDGLGGRSGLGAKDWVDNPVGERGNVL